MSCLFVEASITTPSIVFIPYQQNKKKLDNKIKNCPLRGVTWIIWSSKIQRNLCRDEHNFFTLAELWFGDLSTMHEVVKKLEIIDQFLRF